MHLDSTPQCVNPVLHSINNHKHYLMTLKTADTTEKIEGFSFVNQLVIVVMTAPVFVLGIFWETIISVAGGAKLFIQ